MKTIISLLPLLGICSSFVTCLTSWKRGQDQHEVDNVILYNWDELLLARERPHQKNADKVKADPFQKAYPTSRKLTHFSWKSCGGEDDAVKLTNLTISPDPIKLGQPIKVTASGEILKQINSPIEVDVVMQKKVFVWILIPCVDGLGSCNFTDVCARLPPPPCPQPMIEANLPCSCPFPTGQYSVKDLEYEIDTKQFPPSLVEGDFRVHIVMKQNDQSIGCYDVVFKIDK